SGGRRCGGGERDERLERVATGEVVGDADGREAGVLEAQQLVAPAVERRHEVGDLCGEPERPRPRTRAHSHTIGRGSASRTPYAPSETARAPSRRPAADRRG